MSTKRGSMAASSASVRSVYTMGDQKVLQLTVIESIFNEFGFLPLLLKLF